MIEKAALYAISAGVYVFSTTYEGRAVGRIVDAVSQVAADPKRVSVSLMKAGFTSGAVTLGSRFALTVLGGNATAVIEAFGYQSSETTDKFAGFTVEHDEAGTPYVTEGALSEMSCVVCDVLDMGSHILVIGDVEEAHVFSREDALTYAEYRKQKAAGAQGAAKAPSPSSPYPSAPSAPPTDAGNSASATDAESPACRYGWRCMICGYVVEQDTLPDDFTCPRCGVSKDLFERIEL